MACCAFAAFVVSQIVFAFLGLRERFLGAPDPERATQAPNLVAAWRAGDPEVAVEPAKRRRLPLRIAVAFGAGALAFGLTFAVSHASDAESMSTASPTFLCSGGEAR
ncbi:MAG: hypothetical protein ACRDMZ_07875 [Solirubrobacteraceae bacterium]